MDTLTLFTATASKASAYSTIIMFVLVIVFFYFLIIRPQKTQEKKEKAMRDSLEVGDEVITNGGIVGIVFSIKDDTVVIETGSDRSKIRVMKWAIAKNLTVHDGDESK
ncbi:preprotein translocase subunit YajC [Ruminococcus sp. YE71]|uniref:preprotein translocase subunit YajC n=1 Tax=unclassified Ruminococcus TaxID=2608920 RepID=UPI00088707EA|nr:MULTISPECIES: preprotein translocase subunit YajC [unclassified Ruminococcus]SDA27359.1 preprotein translocase subunit YajC [Ruminococcus sp. YE78]SFW45163.1 preprotein translocase subunit YajC [Ruminococcus sp. YE71]